MRELINLKQGKLGAKEYALKFTQLSKYAPILVENPKDLINRFMTGVSKVVHEVPLSIILNKGAQFTAQFLKSF